MKESTSTYRKNGSSGDGGGGAGEEAVTLPGSLRISGNPSQCRAHTESRQPIIYVKIFLALSMCENLFGTDEGSPTLPDIFASQEKEWQGKWPCWVCLRSMICGKRKWAGNIRAWH